MAERLRYVNTASTPGGDGTTNNTAGATRAYASLSEAEGAEEDNLATAGDTLRIICGGTVDATDVLFDGWTTGASNGITIECTTDKHDGRSRDVSGTGYQLSGSNTSGTIRWTEDYITIDGLNIKLSGASAGAAVNAIGPFTSADNLSTVKNCVIQGPTTSSTSTLFTASVTNLILDLYNTIIYSGNRGIDTRNSATVTMNYCTFWRTADNIGIVSDTELTCKNTYSGRASGTQQDFWTGGAAPSGSNNISSDTTATVDYTSSLISKAGSSQFTNLTSGSEDFTLKSGSDCEGAGTPIGGITTDIIGTARDGTTPDVGAFEFVTAGGFQVAWARNSNQIIGIEQ